MKQWTQEIEIHKPIEQVWQLFDGSLENTMRILPQVFEHTPIKLTDEVIGSIYLQKFRGGERIVEYNVETIEYEDTPNYKKMKTRFMLAKIYEITAFYELTKKSDNQTQFKYTATNRALKWSVKIFLLFAREKAVIQFVERVKREAEEGYE